MTESSSNRDGAMSPASVTALDYINSQMQLEQEAREKMPYDPNHCTHHDEPVRQQIFACLTCRKKNGDVPNGVCYSCSIQCHSDHDVVELLTKRKFSCDCGTERMASFGGCNLRKNFRSLDKPCETNQYGQNFDGKFCVCSREFTGEQPTTMYQCIMGDACLEDWYHEECILGIPARTKELRANKHPEGENVFEKLESAASNSVQAVDDQMEQDSEPLEGMPNSDDFEGFICWLCVTKHRKAMEKIAKMKEVALMTVVHGEFTSIEERKAKLDPESGSKRPSTDDSNSGAFKKVKDEDGGSVSKVSNASDEHDFSLFLLDGYQERLVASEDEDIRELLKQAPFLGEEEPEYQLQEDEDANSSLLDAGTKALNNLPREKAINGMHAYTAIKERLTAFLKPFADEGKVVTESDVKEFFAKVEERASDQPSLTS